MGVGVAGGYGVFDHLRDGMEKTDDQKLAEANRWVMDEYLKTSRLSKDKIERLHDGPAKGASQALVVITEFSDFECPFCSRVAPDMMKIVSHPFYGEKVKVVFRQNPLDQACNPRLNRPFHKHACTGARVALCAGEQHKFWEMHDQLFANARRLAPKHMAEHGKAVDINTKELRDCVESGRPDKQIKADIELAKEVGVRGTPTIFINGRLVRGAVPYDKLLAAVNYELRELGVKIPVVEPVIEEAPAP
jgi:protein-disulfide isomerase